MISQASLIGGGFAPPPREAPIRAPGFWDVTLDRLRRLVRGPMAAPPPNAARDSLLLDACVALRAGRADDAAALLAPQGRELGSDAAYLNLLGVACEVRREWKVAKRCYGVAISVGPHYEPAQRNMRRIYELYTFGRSDITLDLGDAELRRDRAVSERNHDAQ